MCEQAPYTRITAHHIHATVHASHQNYATAHRYKHPVSAQPRYSVKNRNDTPPK